MESIGTQFKVARDAKGSTLSQAASATRIKIQHLEAMERDDFSNMAAAAYARGFIKIYAEYLDLPVEPLVKAYSELHAPGTRRQGLVSDYVAEPPRATAAGQPDDGRERGWSHLVANTGFLRRIALPVAVIVLGVLLLVGLARLMAGGCSSAAGETGAGRGANTADTLRVANPPDVYLDVTTGGSPP